MLNPRGLLLHYLAAQKISPQSWAWKPSLSLSSRRGKGRRRRTQSWPDGSKRSRTLKPGPGCPSTPRKPLQCPASSWKRPPRDIRRSLRSQVQVLGRRKAVEDVTGTLPARSARGAWQPTVASVPTAGICPGGVQSSKVFQCQLWHTEVPADQREV